jgi:hypothetical protein
MRLRRVVAEILSSFTRYVHPSTTHTGGSANSIAVCPAWPAAAMTTATTAATTTATTTRVT